MVTLFPSRPSTQANAQQQLPMLAAAGKPEHVEDRFIEHCDTMLDSIHLCIHLSRMPHHTIAERLGIDKGHWTRMMQSQAHFPPNKLVSLMELCGNYAPMQWLAHATGHKLSSRRKAEHMVKAA